MITIQDMLTHLATQLDSPMVGTTEAKARTAVLSAWSILMSETWRYFHRQSVVQVYAFENTGTVDYSLSYNTVTLTGATWPTDAENMHIRLNDSWYPVKKRTSSTVLELEEESHPPEALDDATFHIQQLIYPLPVYVGEVVQLIDPKRPLVLSQLDLLSTHALSTIMGTSGYPRTYSLVASPKYPGRYCLWIPNLLSEDCSLQYLYLQRRPERTLIREAAGTVSLSAGVATFSEAVVTDLWEGAVLRVSRNNESPTGDFGDDQAGEIVFNPNCYEVLVTENLTSTTCLVNDTTISATGAPYVASTLLDVKGGAMQEYLQRLVEDQYGVRPVANHTEGLTSRRRVIEANKRAHEEDGSGYHSSSSLIPAWYRLRLSDFASGVST